MSLIEFFINDQPDNIITQLQQSINNNLSISNNIDDDDDDHQSIVDDNDSENDVNNKELIEQLIDDALNNNNDHQLIDCDEKRDDINEQNGQIVNYCSNIDISANQLMELKTNNGNNINNDNCNNKIRCNLSQFFVRSMNEIINENFIKNKKDLKQTKEFIFRQKHFSPSRSSSLNNIFINNQNEKIEKVQQWIRSIPKLIPNDYNNIIMEKKVKFHEKITVEPKSSRSLMKLNAIKFSNDNNHQNNSNDGDSSDDNNNNNYYYNQNENDIDNEQSLQLDETVYKILEKIFEHTKSHDNDDDKINNVDNNGHNDDDNNRNDCDDNESNDLSDSPSSTLTETILSNSLSSMPDSITLASAAISAPKSTEIIENSNDRTKRHRSLSSSTLSLPKQSNKFVKKFIKICKQSGKHVTCIQDIKKHIALLTEIIRRNYYFTCSSCRERNYNCQCLDAINDTANNDDLNNIVNDNDSNLYGFIDCKLKKSSSTSHLLSSILMKNKDCKFFTNKSIFNNQSKQKEHQQQQQQQPQQSAAYYYYYYQYYYYYNQHDTNWTNMNQYQQQSFGHNQHRYGDQNYSNGKHRNNSNIKNDKNRKNSVRQSVIGDRKSSSIKHHSSLISLNRNEFFVIEN